MQTFLVDSLTSINLVAQPTIVLIYNHFRFYHLMKNNIKFNPLVFTLFIILLHHLADYLVKMILFFNITFSMKEAL